MNMDKTRKKLLFVLGNGFDLQLGLKSSYSDFFKYLDELAPTLKNTKHYYMKGDEFHEKISDDLNKVTIWPYIFYLNSYKDSTNNWMDIEFQIHNFLTPNNLEERYYTIQILKANSETLIQTYTQQQGFESFNNVSSVFSQNKRLEDTYFHFSKALLLHLDLVTKEHDIRKSKIKTNLIYDYLLLELNKFEKIFNDYMNLQLNKIVDYQRKSENQLRQFANYNEEYTTFILNFNYTRIFQGPGRNNFERNIHGTLDNSQESNIIFGIDSNDITSSSKKYLFSKTFRVINNNVNLSSKDTMIIPEELDYIFFYGHSLGAQDYSYFQSIFDRINLYSGKTILRFLYTPYHNTIEQNQKYKQEINLAVSTLVEEYGKSFEQEKIKGKNLLHRLLVENRIEIMEFNPEKEAKTNE